MTANLPALLAAVAVLVAAAAVRPSRATRRRPLAPYGHDLRPAPRDPVASLGAVLRQRARRPSDSSLDRRTGWATLAALALLLLSPSLAMLWLVAWAVGATLRRRRRAQQGDRDLLGELPDVVDLLVLATSAGCTVPLAVAVVAEHGRGALASELDRARRNAEVGTSLADELDDIASRLGDAVRPVTRSLAAALRDGAPLGPALERIAADVRTQRRRAAEERARKVSVRLLFPLVCCVLPAFALLTVVPLLVSSLRHLAF